MSKEEEMFGVFKTISSRVNSFDYEQIFIKISEFKKKEEAIKDIIDYPEKYPHESYIIQFIKYTK